MVEKKNSAKTTPWLLSR